MRITRRSEWKATTLGAEFDWSSGGTPKSTEPSYYDGGIPWAIIGDLDDGPLETTARTISEAGLRNSSAKWAEDGSVLIAMYGSIGKLGIAMRRLTTNQAIAFTKPRSCTTKYLFWYLLFARPELIRLGKGGTQSNISQTVLKAFPFTLPPAPEQEEIVAEIEKQLTRLDAGVAALRRVQANLKRYRAAVLKAACEGRLVPTEAELARKEGRTFETGADLLGRILDGRRESWHGRGKYQEPATAEAARLPSLPEGWAWARAEQLCGFITKGTTPAAQKLRTGTGDVPFIRVNNLTVTGALDLSCRPVFIDRKVHAEELARSRVRPGDILINIVGPPLGQVSVVPFSIPEANINQAIARFRVVLPECRPLLTLQLMADSVIGWATKRAKTTAGQSNLTLQLCRDLPVPLPPLAEQTRIVAEADRRLSVVEELEASVAANLHRAARLRQAVLQRAFTFPRGFFPEGSRSDPA